MHTVSPDPLRGLVTLYAMCDNEMQLFSERVACRSSWQRKAKTNTVNDTNGAQTYCIINERDQLAAKECNRVLYYRQKLEKLFCVSENGTLTVSDRSTTCVPKSSRGFLQLSVWNSEKY